MAAATIAIEMIQNVIPTGSVGSKLPEAKLKVGSPANRIAGNISVSYTHLTLPTNREV